VRAELTDLDQIEGLFLAADGHFEEIGPAGLDILVNSAGTFVRTPIGSTAEADYDQQMAVNAKGPFFVLQHAVERLRRGGRIVNVSTVTTRWPRLQESVYAASKAALEQFTGSPPGNSASAASPSTWCRPTPPTAARAACCAAPPPTKCARRWPSRRRWELSAR
jgi:hypothetical protein